MNLKPLRLRQLLEMGHLAHVANGEGPALSVADLQLLYRTIKRREDAKRRRKNGPGRR
jgi:hypothetical protein